MAGPVLRPSLGRRPIVGSVISVGGTGALALLLLPFRDHLDNATSGLAFLVPLVLGAAWGGPGAAAAGVAAGFVAYNALFTLPYGTLAVTHLPDVVGLLVYSLVGALTAAIVTLHQREVDSARRREVEALTLAEMSRSLISGVELDAVLRPMVRGARQLFGLRAAMVLLPGSTSGAEVVVAEGDSLSPTSHDNGVPPFHTASDVRAFALRVDDTNVGWLIVAGEVDVSEVRVLQAFADHAALAVNRTALVAHATRVQVLEEADRLRSALMRSVSHDLRTPLASITAAAEDLNEPGLALGAEDRRVLASTIATESRRLDRLVGDLLDVSRIESGRLEVHPQIVEIADLVFSALGETPQSDVEVMLGPEPLLVRADPVLIEQVLRNLIDNALRFSPAGTCPRVTATRRDGVVSVAVADHGPGVTATERSRIFEVFYSPMDGEGSRASGVGLAICQGFVAAHGGNIWVDETLGGGATFMFTLPAATEFNAHRAVPVAAARSQETSDG